jgi:GNAT superfamily N-acetyltransferase
MEVKERVTFAQERFIDCYQEAMPLLQQHYESIAHYKDIPLCVDHLRYHNVENAGGLKVYTVRVDGALIGYCAFFVQQHLHYGTSKQAMQDVIYIDPAYRKGRLGLRLIKFCEEQLREEGVQVIMQHAKIAHPALGVILERNGYEAMDTIYVKRLDRE